jgi:hypothetical protein
MRTLSRVLALILFSAAPSLSVAQEAAPAAGPLVYVYSGGLDALLVDERDEGLHRALLMLDDRLAELPGELGADVPEPVLRLLTDVAFGPHDFELHVSTLEEAQGEMPVAAQLRAFGDQKKRTALSQGIAGILELIGMQSRPVEGQTYSEIPLPAGSLLHGEMAPGSGTEGYFVAYGPPHAGAPRLAGHDLPQGIEPAFLIEIDSRTLRPYLEMAVDMGGPQSDLLYEMFDMFGLFGEDPLGYRIAVGHGDDSMHLVGRTVNGVAALESLGTLVREPLTAEEMRLVPMDAVQAAMWKSDLGFMTELFELLGDAVGEDIFGELEAQTGIHFGNDVFDVLGQLGGYYMADSTGGGGLMSMVFFTSLKDSTRMEATLDKVANKVEELGRMYAQGYVAMRSWEHEGLACRSLRFPGVPAPFEPSMAIQDGILWMGASPQALLAALRHAKSGAKGLVEGGRFKSSASGSLENLNSFSYQDTPRLVRDGYGMATLLFAGLANAVRSPHDASRDPGLILPPYEDFAHGSRATVMLGRIEGPDLVVRGEGDRSIAANVTAAMSNPLVLVMAASSFLSALGQGVQQAVAPAAPIEWEPVDEHADHEQY